MFVRRLALGCLLAAALPAAALADSRITFKATEGGGSATLQSILVGQGKLRIEADATTSVLIDPATETIVLINHGQKQFIRMTRADMDSMMKMLDGAMKQMEQVLASMPPEQRAKMQAAMGGALGGGAGAPAIEMANTGQTAKVGGQTCRVFRASLSGRPVSEICYGDIAAVKLPAADRATLQAAMKMGKEMTERLSKGPLGQFMKGSPFSAEGFPLRTTDFAADGSRRTSEFAGVTTTPIPADMFAVPAGYTEQKLPGIGRGGR